MMTTYTYTDARQNFATVLDKARQEGEVLIKRKDGSCFVLRPVYSEKSPLDVEGIDLNISSEEIVDIIREVRRK